MTAVASAVLMALSTMYFALEINVTSITGHLVLSTLHTNNSLTTIERLLDMDVERYLLSSSL